MEKESGITMKRKDAIKLNDAIRAALTLKGCVRFVNGLLYDKNRIKETIATHEEVIKKFREPLKEHDEAYNKDNSDLIIKYGIVQPDRSVMIKPGDENFLIYIKDLTKLEKVLAEKYKDELEKFESDMKEYEPILEEEVEFEPYTIKLEDFPNPFDAALHETFFNAGIIREE